jgi:hypothetical protein
MPHIPELAKSISVLACEHLLADIRSAVSQMLIFLIAPVFGGAAFRILGCSDSEKCACLVNPLAGDPNG